MKIKFCTNKNTILFYVILSLILFIPGWINFYHIITNQGSYVMGSKVFLVLILPILCYFSYKKNLLIISDDRFQFGKQYFKFENYNLLISQKKLKFKDRPLISPWKENYPVIVIQNKATKEEEINYLEMSGKQLEKLSNLIKMNSIPIK
jgi:hypothetical protein